MITYKLSDLKEKYPSEVSLEAEDGVTYVYCQGFRMGILEGDTVTLSGPSPKIIVPKYMINAGVLILLDDVPYEIAKLVYIVQEIDDLLGIYPIRYFTVEDPSDLKATHTAIEKAFEPYCGKITVEGHWALWEGVPEYGYYLDYAVLDEL